MNYTARFSNGKLLWVFEFSSDIQINTGDYLTFDFLSLTSINDIDGSATMKEFGEMHAFYDRFRIEKKIIDKFSYCVLILTFCD